MRESPHNSSKNSYGSTRASISSTWDHAGWEKLSSLQAWRTRPLLKDIQPSSDPCRRSSTSSNSKTSPGYQIGDTLYTWAPSGLNVRAEASASSSKVGKLQPGDRVIILTRTEIPFNLTVIAAPKALEDEYLEDYSTSPYQLQGHWVKVAGPGFSGYVIDMYLLAWQPPAPKTFFHAYFEKLSGESILMDTMWQRDASGNRDLDIYRYRGESSEGIIFEGSSGEGAVDDAIAIPDMTLEEGFVFCNFFMPLEDGLRIERGLEPLELYRHNEREISMTEDELCYFAVSVVSGMLRIGWGCSC